METLASLALGLSVALTPTNLWYLLLGVVVGMAIGIFPGLGPAAGIAILLPLTLDLQPVTGVIMLAGIYYATMYGATITAILINTPGASSVVASTFDGYPLARRGRAAPALVMQAAASFAGGTVGVLLLTLLAPVFGRMARSFGPPEFFMVAMLGILTLAALLGERRRYGIVSALIGFALATVGVDVGSGRQRFTFGSAELLGGIDFIPVVIGLFGVGELLHCVARGDHLREGSAIPVGGRGSFWPSAREWAQGRFAILRGSVVGFVLGVVPGAGATVASLLAYSAEKAISRSPERFGRGAMEGLAAPEAANNAASAGAMIPLLTLGIPGSASTAVLLGAFVMWGLRPGPLLLEQNPELAWGLVASMYLGNVMLVLLCILAIPLFAVMVRVPFRVLAPVVFVLCTVGAWSVNGSLLETVVMLAAGVLGFLMKQFGFSPAALIVALVLGPLAEGTLQQSLIISGGSPLIFVTRPVSLAIGLAALGILLAAPLLRRAGAGRAPEVRGTEEPAGAAEGR